MCAMRFGEDVRVCGHGGGRLAQAEKPFPPSGTCLWFVVQVMLLLRLGCGAWRCVGALCMATGTGQYQPPHAHATPAPKRSSCPLDQVCVSRAPLR